jgi:hypothetical protein
MEQDSDTDKMLLSKSVIPEVQQLLLGYSNVFASVVEYSHIEAVVIPFLSSLGQGQST